MKTNRLKCAVGVCVLVASSVIAAGEAELGATPHKGGGNIQVDFRFEMGQGASQTNRNLSLCIREDTEIVTKEVTNLSYVEKDGAEKGSVRFIEVGTCANVRVGTLDAANGIALVAKLEMSDAVATNKQDVPVVRKKYIEFTTVHKDAAFVRVLSAESLSSQSGEPVTIYVRAAKAAEAPKGAIQTEKAQH